MKIAKRILKRSADPWLALLEWCNTPTVGMGSSPCQRLFSRRTRSVVPVKETQLEPVPQVNIQERKVQRQKIVQRQNQLKGLDLPPLRVGQPVLMQDLKAKRTEWQRGVCQGKLSDRSYVVEVEGQLLHRYSRFLRNTVNGPGDSLEDERWSGGSQSEGKPTVS